MATKTLPRILVAEEDHQVRHLIATVLENAGLEVVAVADGGEALAKLMELRFDALVLDGHMPRFGGLEVLERARAVMPDVPAVVVSGSPRIEPDVIVARAIFVSKPFSPSGLVYVIRRALNLED